MIGRNGPKTLVLHDRVAPIDCVKDGRINVAAPWIGLTTANYTGGIDQRGEPLYCTHFCTYAPSKSGIIRGVRIAKSGKEDWRKPNNQ